VSKGGIPARLDDVLSNPNISAPYGAAMGPWGKVQSVENSELHDFSNCASRSGHQAVVQSGVRLKSQPFIP